MIVLRNAVYVMLRKVANLGLSLFLAQGNHGVVKR